MSRRYTPQEKADILERLDDNFGNVTLTALQTGVPARTLYEWKRQRKLRRLQRGEPLLHKKNVPPQQQTAADPDPSGDDPPDDPPNEYARIRQRLMEHVDTLIETLTDDPDTAHLRIVALSRLLDRVIKLEALARPPAEETVIRWEFVYPDGAVHAVPPWGQEPADEPPPDPEARPSPPWHNSPT